MKLLLDDKIIDSAITPQALKLYLKLVSMSGDKGTCFPTQEHLAEKLNLTSRSIRIYINELKEWGLIKVYRDRSIKKAVNHYAVIPVEWVDMKNKIKGTEADIKNLEDFETLVEDIANYYKEEFSLISKIEETIDEKSSLNERLEEIKNKKINNKKLSSKDFVVIFAGAMKEKYPRSSINVNSQKNSEIIKNCLMSIDGFIDEEIENFLKFYVENYSRLGLDKINKNYTKPNLNGLKKDWLFNKVVEAYDNSRVNIELVNKYSKVEVL